MGPINALAIAFALSESHSKHQGIRVMRLFRWMIPLVVFAALLPTGALAYVGPGAGLGALAALAAVVGAILIALFGIIVMPINMLLKRRRKEAADTDLAADAAPAKVPDLVSDD